MLAYFKTNLNNKFKYLNSIKNGISIWQVTEYRESLHLVHSFNNKVLFNYVISLCAMYSKAYYMN